MSAKAANPKPAGSGDLAGRFGAWWSGKEYVAPVPGEEGAAAPEPKPEAAKAEAPKKPKLEVVQAEPAPTPAAPEADTAVREPTAVRLKALSAIWGEGRLAPSTPELDSRLLEPVLNSATANGAIGFLGADAALVNSCKSRTDRPVRIAEWRSAVCDALRAGCPGVDVQAVEIDRPRAFADGSLDALVSIDAFAFADHKAGLVARVFRSLSDTGCWAFLDTVRTTGKAPPSAFASAWAEPQVTTADDIESLLTMAGFKTVKKHLVTDEMIYAARAGYARLAVALEEAATGGFKGREGALFLQELAWEAQSWRARSRALEGGALGAHVWLASKVELPSGLDQASIDDLF